MEDKYYTPTLEEFHVGFEYEVKSNVTNNEWFKLNLNAKNYYLNIDRVLNLSETIRVKKLDREDIESFGFKNEHNFYSLNIVNDYGNIIHLIHESDKNHILICRGSDEMTFNDFENLFMGTIKNRSELARLLKQLGII